MRSSPGEEVGAGLNMAAWTVAGVSRVWISWRKSISDSGSGKISGKKSLGRCFGKDCWCNLASDLGLVSPLFGPEARFQAFLELSGLKLVSSFLGSA